ncbi:hypothetical protein PLICRDRAFT_176752 [Plicaturopsis crispa FD-325 SS-3]|nr:hypothetical protein PLICRDRAFT_176752 [Plicaturopsis crispa FD-325 SS-3]
MADSAATCTRIAHNYLTGSQQQQITLYPHRDENNDFRIMNATFDGQHEFDWEHSPLHYIKGGDHIKLRHITTEKHVNSHDHRPPVSDVDFQNEVSAYGFPGIAGNANDDWIVEIEHGHKRDSELPSLLEWGYEQQEATCNKNAVRHNSLWFIETSMHPQLPPDAPKLNYRLVGFPVALYIVVRGILIRRAKRGPWTRTQCNNAKWLKTWDFSCNDFLDDTALYGGHIVATPKKSSIPVATVGGEAGGRPAIVVEDKLAQDVDIPPPQDPETSTLALGQAEPGRDIFTGEPVKKVKSAAVQAQQEKVEKEIGFVGTHQESTIAESSEQQERNETVAHATASSGSTTASLASSITQASTLEPEVAASTTESAGPIGEDDAEADRVDADLFPDGLHTGLQHAKYSVPTWTTSPHCNDFGTQYNVCNAPENVTNNIYELTKTIKRYTAIKAAPVDLSKIGEFAYGPTTSFLRENAATFRVLSDGLHGNYVPLPDFGGGHPDPNLTYAPKLVQAVEKGNIAFGAASDGDGDRNIIYGKGAFVTPRRRGAQLHRKHVRNCQFLRAWTYQGLEQRLGEDAPGVLEQGRSGFATGYNNDYATPRSHIRYYHRFIPPPHPAELPQQESPTVVRSCCPHPKAKPKGPPPPRPQTFLFPLPSHPHHQHHHGRVSPIFWAKVRVVAAARIPRRAAYGVIYTQRSLRAQLKGITTTPGKQCVGEPETEADKPPRHLPTARIIPPSASLVPPNTLQERLAPLLFEFPGLLSVVPAVLGRASLCASPPESYLNEARRAERRSHFPLRHSKVNLSTSRKRPWASCLYVPKQCLDGATSEARMAERSSALRKFDFSTGCERHVPDRWA